MFISCVKVIAKRHFQCCTFQLVWRRKNISTFRFARENTHWL